MPQPPFEPTDEQRRLVESLAAYGMPQVEIAKLVINPKTGRGISNKTLWAHFPDELDAGSVKANAKVAQNLYRVATAEEITGPTVTAMIFWLKCRAGWKDTSRLEHTGADGAPLVSDGVERLKNRIDRIAGRIAEDDDEDNPRRIN